MSALAGRRVLLVEDEAIVAMLLESMLSDLGCVVVDVAGSLSQGLSLAGDIGIDLDAAILDVNLGGEKVYPVAHSLTSRGVPFVFSSGYDLSEITPHFAGIPALAKPYGASALQRALLSILPPR